MPIWISRPGHSLSRLGLAAFLTTPLVLALPSAASHADVITQLPSPSSGQSLEKRVALTFDACESRTPVTLDRRISDYLVQARIPFTIFAAGHFARHNGSDLSALVRTGLVEIENHSMNHNNHMDRMTEDEVVREVADADAAIFAVTGQHTHLFRFPAGIYSPLALQTVEKMGYRVVHWSFPSGDPARVVTPQHLQEWVLSQTKPSNILIFHINGRGWSTPDALPGIVAELQRRGYRFTTLADALKP